MVQMKHTLKLESLTDGWQGSLVMEAPLHTERLKVISKAGFHRMQNPKEGEEQDNVDRIFAQQLPALLEVYDNARKHILEVNIVGPDGEVINDINTFERHEATAACFSQIATAYMLGFGPGKKKS